MTIDAAAAANRMLAGAAVAFIGPVLDQKFGIKLTDGQVYELALAAPILWHAAAAFAQKCVAAFVLYFPPPSMRAPVPAPSPPASHHPGDPQ